MPLVFVQITALNLDSQRIYELTNLNRLVNLRWASFNDNDIPEVDGLSSCSKLEELSLNNNCISTLSGSSLTALESIVAIIISVTVFALCFCQAWTTYIASPN